MKRFCVLPRNFDEEPVGHAIYLIDINWEINFHFPKSLYNAYLKLHVVVIV